MTDRPIPFSGPMVRALLAGTKTQTRRTIKSARVFATPESKAFTINSDQLARALQGAARFRRLDGNGWYWEADAFDYQHADRTGWMAHIGYAPGDRLYVREHWRTWEGYDEVAPRDLRPPVGLWYEADEGRFVAGRFRQGMHMPRWASRITLTVTDVRVERLQDIGTADAIAEGIEHSGDGYAAPGMSWVGSPELAYRCLWEAINGSGSWDANPWVVAYTFSLQHGNIDQIGAE